LPHWSLWAVAVALVPQLMQATSRHQSPQEDKDETREKPSRLHAPRHCSRPPPRVLVVLDMIWAARAGHASRGSWAASGMYQWYSPDTMHDASLITRAGLTSTARSYVLLTGRIASCGCLRVSMRVTVSPHPPTSCIVTFYSLYWL